jgi:hypothetical protein
MKRWHRHAPVSVTRSIDTGRGSEAMQNERLRQSLTRTVRAFSNLLPILIGMVLLTSLAVTALPRELLNRGFGRHELIDVLLGTGLGSLAAGHPLASYVLGGELLAAGVSLIAVTALIVSWVTVGLVQLPAEALLLGRRFAIYRNLGCLVFSVAIAFLTVYTMDLLG